MAHGLIWQMAHWISPWNHSLKCVCERACVYECVCLCLCNSSETKTPQSVLLTIQVYIRISTRSWQPDTGIVVGLVSRPSVLPCGLLHLAGSHYLVCLFDALSYSQPIIRLMYSVREMSSWTFAVASAVVRVFSVCGSSPVDPDRLSPVRKQLNLAHLCRCAVVFLVLWILDLLRSE